MRPGLLRSLSAFLGVAAFAVTAAGPAQWDPCPMHGIAPHAPAAAMHMPAGHEAAPASSHPADVPGRHGAGHQCTCPGGCFGSNPVGIRSGALRAPVATYAMAAASRATAAGTIARAQSPQLALPPAMAPPAPGLTPQRAAHITT
jgi:hypothetical protein